MALHLWRAIILTSTLVTIVTCSSSTNLPGSGLFSSSTSFKGVQSVSEHEYADYPVTSATPGIVLLSDKDLVSSYQDGPNEDQMEHHYKQPRVLTTINEDPDKATFLTTSSIMMQPSSTLEVSEMTTTKISPTTTLDVQWMTTKRPLPNEETTQRIMPTTTRVPNSPTEDVVTEIRYSTSGDTPTEKPSLTSGNTTTKIPIADSEDITTKKTIVTSEDIPLKTSGISRDTTKELTTTATSEESVTKDSSILKDYLSSGYDLTTKSPVTTSSDVISKDLTTTIERLTTKLPPTTTTTTTTTESSIMTTTPTGPRLTTPRCRTGPPKQGRPTRRPSTTAQPEVPSKMEPRKKPTVGTHKQACPRPEDIHPCECIEIRSHQNPEEIETVALCKNIRNMEVLKDAMKGMQGHFLKYFVMDSCKMPPFPNGLFHNVGVGWLEMLNSTVQFHQSFFSCTNGCW